MQPTSAANLLRVAAAILLCQLAHGTASASTKLDASVAVLERPGESPAVLLAEHDLESDLRKVFGRAPRIIHSLDSAGSLTIVVNAEALASQAATQPEAFQLSLETAPQGRTFLHLDGASPRGAIYAIYTFSERYLGVDPMYFWTDLEPARRISIPLPATLGRGVETPVFRYRGFFINDEDLLTGWAPAAANEHTGISLQVWDKVFETVLRLKGNMIAPGSWTFPDDAQMKAANARGLILTQHHATPLGVNVARWPKDAPYNYTTHPEVLEHAWRNAVAAYAPDADVLWSVGLRGLTDGSYDSADPSVRGNDQALGAVISKAIATQMAIVRERFPHARFITNLWREGVRLANEGYLHIPPEVTIVWADSGSGDMQDNGALKPGNGAYFHLAMVDGTSNQLSELVPVDRIESQLKRYQDAQATDYLLLNTSDIRPVVMTARAAMDAAWNGVAKPAPEAANDFYQQWATQQFGVAAASAVAPLYKLYFAAPAHNDRTGKPFGDQGYHTYARQMLLDETINVPTFFIADQVPTWTAPIVSDGEYGRNELPKLLQDVLTNCPAAQLRWDSLWTKAIAAEKLVAPNRRNAYQAQLLTMIAVNRQSNRMLLSVAQSIQAAETGQKATALRSIQTAEDALSALSQQEHAAEFGKWRNWYRGDWLVGVPRSADALAAYHRYLNDPLSPMPAPFIWSSWEAYYHILHYEADRSVNVQ